MKGLKKSGVTPGGGGRPGESGGGGMNCDMAEGLD